MGLYRFASVLGITLLAACSLQGIADSPPPSPGTTDAAELDADVDAALDATLPQLAVINFTLIDTNVDGPVAGYDPLPDGSKLSRAALPPALSLRANVAPAIVPSVVFAVNSNPAHRIESEPPYALGRSTAAGDYSPWDLGFGEYVVTATPFDAPGGMGAPGTSATVRFQIVP